MNCAESPITTFLKEHQIPYTPYTHPAVFTSAEAAVHCSHVPGLDCKNLFLKSEDGRYFLVTIPAVKRLDLKALSQELGTKKLRFGAAEELWDVLKIKPGAVSPLGLVNDSEKRTTYIVDQDVWDAKELSIHPNVNTESFVFKRDAFQTLVKALGTKYHVHTL